MNGGLRSIVDGINWPRLRFQKAVMVKLANEQDDDHKDHRREEYTSELWGVIYLIDQLQDWAVDVGGIDEKDVFTTEEASITTIDAGTNGRERKKKFRVSWTEDHCAVVEAKDEADAHWQVHNEDNHWKPGDTFVDQQTGDISEVKEESNG